MFGVQGCLGLGFRMLDILSGEERSSQKAKNVIRGKTALVRNYPDHCLCTRSCGMHVLASLPVLVALMFFFLPVRLNLWPTLLIFLLCALTSSFNILRLKKRKKGRKKRTRKTKNRGVGKTKRMNETTNLRKLVQNLKKHQFWSLKTLMH